MRRLQSPLLGIASPMHKDLGGGAGGTQYLWWRIRLTTAGSYSGGGLAQIALHDTVGGSNIAVGGTASVSGGSSFNGGTFSQNAWDLVDPALEWAGAANAITNGIAWSDYTLASAAAVVEVVITARASVGNQMGTAFNVDGSDDGVTWDTVWSESGLAAWTNGEVRTFAKP